MGVYSLLPRGVLRTTDNVVLVPQSGAPWEEYIAWLVAGNLPDPYVAPSPPGETLAQAKERRIYSIKNLGLVRMQTKIQALKSFDDVELVREIVQSIAPAARTLTAKIQNVADTYAAGAAAIALVNAATTIAAVDAVTVTWPT